MTTTERAAPGPPRIDVVTIFPDYLRPLELSLVGRARADGVVDIRVHDLREHATDRHRTVDDTPMGGGAGMVMRPDVWARAIEATNEDDPRDVVLVVPTPSGTPFTQGRAHELADAVRSATRVVIACGRYEGIDARLAEHYATRPGVSVHEISIGDYVLGGGEVAALVVVEAVVRLLPGVLGNPASLDEESFGRAGLLEYPVYTRPPSWAGIDVPDVLLSGHHGAIARWRRDASLARTARRRPDLVEALDPGALDARDREVLDAEGYAVAAGRVRRPPRLRRATAADVAALADLAAATFPLACPPSTTLGSVRAFVAEHLTAERFAGYVADPGRAVLVAEDAAGLVGYTMLVDGEPYDAGVATLVTERPTIELSKCYALPRAHGTGTSRRLIDASIAEARARGAASVWLGVNRENTRARAFYAKAGFAVVGERAFRVGDRLENDAVLVRRLSGETD